jgi:hypothetical protein
MYVVASVAAMDTDADTDGSDAPDVAALVDDDVLEHAASRMVASASAASGFVRVIRCLSS